MTRGRALLFGALTVGVLDLLDAFVFFYVRANLRGTQLLRVPQGIAAGLLGRDAARAGGWATAGLGTLLHFFNATIVVLVFYFASRRLQFLVQRPWLYGPLYGIVVFTVMQYVVIPFSAITPGPMSTAALVNGILIHLVGVGRPTALVSRAAQSANS